MDINYYKKYEPLFGSWRIVREIGAGSFGRVFEIEREEFGYTYRAALKAVTIPQNPSEIESIMDDGMDKGSATEYFRGFVEELLGEFRIMSKLKGESNVVSCEDYIVIPHTDGIGWDILMRMELLTPLRQFVRTQPFDRAGIISLGIDICNALELCRKHGIIHRDIKPENIFVSDNGNFKLGDFGIARTIEKTCGGLSKKGTYTYMAPEVYKGEEYGASVDIYSLGIVLYRYANANREPLVPPAPAPVTYSARSQALEKRMSGTPLLKPIHADDALAQVILKACAYDPRDRYSSPAEMRSALEALEANGAPAALDQALEKEEPSVYMAAAATEVDDETIVMPANDELDETVVTANDAQSETAVSYETEVDDETVVFAEEKTTLLESGQDNRPAGLEPRQTNYETKPVFTEKKPRRNDGIRYFATIALIFTGLLIVALSTPDDGWNIWHTRYYSQGKLVTGWYQADGYNWYYFDDIGKKQIGWLELDGNTYYLNDDGIMATGWNNIPGEGEHYFDDSGIMQIGWLWDDANSGWYYLSPSTGGARAYGKWKIGDAYYYFGYDGTLKTGEVWIESDEISYMFDDNGRFLYCFHYADDSYDYDFGSVDGEN